MTTWYLNQICTCGIKRQPCKRHVEDKIFMKEEIRQRLLEKYGIGVMQLVYSKTDNGMWFGCYRINGDEYETDNFKTRKEAEDKAIAEYESKTESNG